MIRVVFKNLEKSVLAREAAEECMVDIINKFPALRESNIAITLSMDNSPLQRGPDLFGVTARISGGSFGNVILTKTAPSLYTALAQVKEHLLERLNRKTDKSRVKARSKDRDFLELIQSRHR